MIRKVFYWIFTLLQTVLLAAALGIQYFSMKKMGMMRYVVYMNHQWEADYPVMALRYTFVSVLAVLSVITILYALYRKRRYAISKRALSMLVLGTLITLAYIFFMLSYSTESYRSYYFTGIISAIIILMQDIKIIAYLKRDDNSLPRVL